MAEGRKREVRRMLDAVELPVRRLVRVRVGPIRLGKLRPGEVRELEPRGRPGALPRRRSLNGGAGAVVTGGEFGL